MVQHWILWGVGWLAMPRMCIGLLLMWYLSEPKIGLVLAIGGGIIDILSGD